MYDYLCSLAARPGIDGRPSMATETIWIIYIQMQYTLGLLNGLAIAIHSVVISPDYVIVKSTQRSFNPRLLTYGYLKYFCSMFYTSVCILY